MRKFDGVLTPETAEEILGHFKKALVGREFAIVTANEHRGFRPEVCAGQRLGGSTKGEDASVSYDAGSATLMINCTDGVFSVHSWSGEEPAHVTVERGLILVAHRPGAGQRLYWIFLFEEDGHKGD